MWEIWPVSSKQITAVDTVWVTAPVKAAAPVRNMGWDGKGKEGGGKGRVQEEDWKDGGYRWGGKRGERQEKKHEDVKRSSEEQ